MADDLPRIKPYDEALNNRVRVINYEKIFVDNPTNQFEVQKDDNIKNEMKDEAFQRVFLMLFITTYLEFKQNGSVTLILLPYMLLKKIGLGLQIISALLDNFCLILRSQIRKKIL